jgi:hypothetical protein
VDVVGIWSRFWLKRGCHQGNMGVMMCVGGWWTINLKLISIIAGQCEIYQMLIKSEKSSVVVAVTWICWFSTDQEHCSCSTRHPFTPVLHGNFHEFKLEVLAPHGMWSIDPWKLSRTIHDPISFLWIKR